MSSACSVKEVFSWKRKEEEISLVLVHVGVVGGAELCVGWMMDVRRWLRELGSRFRPSTTKQNRRMRRVHSNRTELSTKEYLNT